MPDSLYIEDSAHWIKSCEEEQITRVMAFFGQEWDAGHIMATNRQFIRDYFYNKRDKHYTILVAGQNNREEILGLLCFVENSFFDDSLDGDRCFVWLTNWLVKHDAGGGLGLKLLAAVSKWKTGAIGTLGISAKALPIYQALRYHTGVLKQYFLAHDEKTEFAILRGFHRQSRPQQTGTDALLTAISPEMLIRTAQDEGDGRFTFGPEWASIFDEAFPPKSLAYIYNKYLGMSPTIVPTASRNHGQTQAYALCIGNAAKALLIVKTETHGGAKALRIIEYAGKSDHLRHAYGAFQMLLRAHDAEYIDFCCEGIDDRCLAEAGFQPNNGLSGLIVPDYFHPFQSKNIEIAYAYKHMPDNCRIFRGDGDREHPR